MKPLLIIIAAVSTIFLSRVTALAHGTLAHAVPAVGSMQAAAPREVVLTFTEDLEPAFSTFEVRNESGAVMSSGKADVDPKRRTQMRVPLKVLPPGAYKVIWRILSVDTHRNQGDFTFRVGP